MFGYPSETLRDAANQRQEVAYDGQRNNPCGEHNDDFPHRTVLRSLATCPAEPSESAKSNLGDTGGRTALPAWTIKTSVETQPALGNPKPQLVLLAIALIGVGCGAPNPGPGPATDNAVMRPDLLSVVPAEPSPGDIVEVHWAPVETPRGQCWVLEKREGDGWQHRFHLASSRRGTPPWARAEDGPMCTDIGLGPEPNRLTIPDVATPGLYRLCEVGQDVTRCVEVTIRD